MNKKVFKNNYDSDMPSNELDKIILTSSEKTLGLIRLFLCSAIGIFVFFMSVKNPSGKSEIVFSVVYNFIVNIFGGYIYWILTLIIAFNFISHILFKYIRKNDNSAFADVYKSDNIIHTLLYILGFIYVLFFAINDSFSTPLPEIIVGANTGGSVIPPIVKGVLGIIIAGAIFMPFLLNYGILEIIGALLEPIMRPVFKVPGKAALDATSSFVSSSSLGVLITNRLWKSGVYTDKECCAIMTGFSAVSIGFAYLVINTAGVGHHWIKIYSISFIMVFIIAAISVRIPPISKKSNRYFNKKEQTEADCKGEIKYDSKTISRGFDRAVKRAAIARGIKEDIILSLKDSVLVLPQVLTMLSAIGVSAMILAEYTKIFKYLGYLFYPLLILFQVPDASAIAPSIPVGIAEMFLPVLVMNSSPIDISENARIFICLVSMVQIIFFSETATVMLATKSPISFKEIVICFIERTLIAIPLSALVIHILF